MKQALNNIDINAIVKEIHQDILGKHVKNVYNVDETKFIITYRSSDSNKQLLIDIPNRLNLTQYSYEKPRIPSPFCTSLRKYLKNKRISNFYQIDHLDRIVVLEITSAEGERWQLVLEFFAKGNIILIKPDGNVHIAKRYVKLQNEIILPNKPFTFPEQNFTDIFEIGTNGLLDVARNEDQGIAKALSGKFNIPPAYIDCLLRDAGVDTRKPAKEVITDEITRVDDSISRFKATLEQGKFMPCVIAEDATLEKKTSVEPFMMNLPDGAHVKQYESFNQAVDDYFSGEMKKAAQKQQSQKKQLSKNERILIAQLEQVKNLQDQAKEQEEIGNLLYQYYLPLSNLLEKVYSVRKQGMSWDDIIEKLNAGKKQGLEEATMFHSVDASKPFIFIQVENKIIPLDIRISLKENINKYFYEKSKKAKRKIPGAKQTIERVRALVEKEKEEAAIQQEIPSQKFKKRRKEWFEKFRWFFSSDDYLVLGGRDASSNEVLYTKYMEKKDLFFHSDAPGAPVVIVKNKKNGEINDIPLQTIREAATFGVSYSRAWKANLNAADIYHVPPEQVSKTPPAGEFLPKGSFVIRGDREYFRNVKLEIAIGVKVVRNKLVIQDDREEEPSDEEEPENAKNHEDVYYPAIVGGPPSSLQGKVDFFVKLKPTKDGAPPGNVASKLRLLFSKNVQAPGGAKVAPVDIEEVQAWIPSGKSTIID